MAEVSQRLIDWYWRYGVSRDGRFKLSSEWLNRLYRIGVHAPATASAATLFWGVQNEAFDLAFTRQYVSTFDGLVPERLAGAVRAGIAICADGNLSPDKSEHPVSLVTQAELLRLCGAGYALRCEPEDETISRWRLRPEDIMARAEDDRAEREPDRSATEFMLFLSEAVGHLTKADISRYANLRIAESWERSVRPTLLRSASLQSDLNAAQKLGFQILWDGNDRMTKFFQSLDALRLKIEREANGKALLISSEVLPLLLNPDLARSSGGSRISRAKAKKDEDEGDLKSIALVVREQSVIISLEPKGKRLVQNAEDAVALQVLLDTVHLPSTRLASTSGGTDTISLVNLPRLALRGDEPRVDMTGRSTQADLARDIARSGKAAFAPAAATDRCPQGAMALLVSTSSQPSQSRLFHHMAKAYAGPFGFTSLDGLLATQRDPEASGAFAPLAAIPSETRKGRRLIGIVTGDPVFDSLGEADQDEAADLLAGKPDFRSFFPDDDTENDLFLGFQEEDGGILALAHEAIEKATPSSADDPQSAAQSLIEAARPRVDASEQEHRGAFMTFCEHISDFCSRDETIAERRLAAIQASEMLRESFSLRAGDLDPLPMQLGNNHEAAATYLAQQMSRWAERPVLSVSLDKLGVSPADQAVIIAAIQTIAPIDDMALWMTTEFGGIETSREALHCRRYIATKLSQAILGEDGAGRRRLDASPAALQSLLDAWVLPTTDVEQSLHYEIVVAPMINRFADIADRGVSAPWLRQAGDEEIEAIAAEFIGDAA